MGGNPYNNFFLSFISQFMFLKFFSFLVGLVFIVKCYLCCSTALCLKISKGVNRDGVCIYSYQYAHKTIKGSNQLSDKYFFSECIIEVWGNSNF